MNLNSNRANVIGVVIDPGHGGSDNGATNGNYKEKDFMLEVSNYIEERLQELGMQVATTRNSDETLTQNERIKRILDAFGSSDNVVVISNHLSNTGEGANAIYALRSGNTLTNSIMTAIGNAGQIINTSYQRRLPGDTSKDYYYIHRQTGNTQAIVISYGNINNSNDLNRISSKLLNYGEAVVMAVAGYAGVRYVPVSNGGNVYVVRSGDSLYSIARNFGIKVDDIIKANNLTSNVLNVGQILIIPSVSNVTPPTSKTYVVVSGDSLFSIAQRFGTTVDAIKSVSGITSNALSIGQQLTIPVLSGNNNYISYTVRSGDSLYSIAQRHNTTVSAIQSLNNLTSNLLNIGQILKLPQ